MSTTTTRPRPPRPRDPESPVAATPRPTTRPMRDPSALAPALRVRRAITLLLMTIVVPGSAQVTAGNRRFGRVGLRIWFSLMGVAVALGLIYLIDRPFVIGLFTRGSTLLIMVIGLIVLAVVWAALFVDAWRLGAPSLQPTAARRGIAILAVALVAGTSGPMLFAAKQVSAGRTLITTVFGGNKHSAAVDGRYNVLLMGGDAGSDRTGLRPDSMTLLSIDQNTGRTVMFSLPRNFERAPFPVTSPMHRVFPHGFDCGDVCLLNAIYTYASDHKGIYPPSVRNPGAQATMDAISAITGLTVNYYALIDLRGFQDLINAMGGVTVNVKQRVPIGGETTKVSGYIDVGTQHLTGYRALWFARSRTGSSDYARMARQRCVMTAMLQQMSPETVLLKFQGIASASSKVISTSIPEGDLGTFVDLALKAKSQKVTSVQFVPPLIDVVHPDIAKIHQIVAQTIAAAENSGTSASKASSSSSASHASSASSGSSSSTTAGSSSSTTAGSSGSSGSSTSPAVDANAVCAAG